VAEEFLRANFRSYDGGVFARPINYSSIAMNSEQFAHSLADEVPPAELSLPLKALWWDAKGDWTQAHAQVDELESQDGMAVHAYLHRKEGDASNADYWYRRSTAAHRRPTLEAEWKALLDALLA
jgi:hypothetical protein